MDGWLIALILFALWAVLLIVLYKMKKLKGPISLYGPALMIKTKKGIGFIKRVSLSKFWKYYGNFAVAFSLIIMVGVFLLILWQAFLVTTIPSSEAPSPVQALGIPGINPIIPVGYGILGLVIAIVIHEFSHGFLVAFQKLKLKSIGVLLLIVPIGAFVEPDEEELWKTKRRKRMRVFAAGPTSNLLLAIFIIILLLGLGSGVSPKYHAFYVASNFEENPNFDMLPVGTVILKINNTPINSYTDFMNVNAPLPGQKVNLMVDLEGVKNISAYSGVVVSSVLQGYPAYDAGIKPGWIFYSINGSIVRNQSDFYAILNQTKSGMPVEIKMFKPPNQWMNITVTLADKYEYFEKYAPQLNKEWYRGKGFLGINAGYLGIGLGDANYLKTLVFNPYQYVQNPTDIFRATMGYIALPFMGLMPFPQNLEHLYNVPFSGFWIIVNSLYWIFWINLMLGMTNLLPAVPLDGGYIFKDFITYIGEKLKIKDPKRFGNSMTITFSLMVLFLVLWQFIGPRI
ncbi:peptidase M50 [Nanoarchaeota archaeon]|nr:MAG: peptidase M50 [Nanoarchaeota archaeon]